MAITFIREQNKWRYALIGFLVVLLIGGAVFASGLFQKVPGQVFEPVAPQLKSKINFEILRHPIFKGLEEPPEPLAFPEQVGRENPFKPAVPSTE